MIAALGLVLVGCARGPRLYHDTFLAMDSVVALSVVAASPAAAERAFAAARREVERLESILSDYRSESNVCRLNARTTTELAPETRLLLEHAHRACVETDGAVDVTLRRVKRLWGFGTGGTPHVPDSAAVRALLPRPGSSRYEITPDGRFAWRDSLADLDLGGIAQGYVAACVAETLQGRGVANFLIDVSGDLVGAGRRPDGGRWRIGLQNPRQPDSLLTRFDLDARAVTTSGDYEQFFETGGVRYHHIFDPRTGWPARGVVSATVLADDPIDADCMTKAVFVMGRERGLAFLNARPDLRGAIVTEQVPGRLHVEWSDGLGSR